MSSDNGFKVNDILKDVEENIYDNELPFQACTFLFSAVVDQDWEK